MATRKEILAGVKQSSESGAEYVSKFQALEDKTARAVYPLVRGYIRKRFLLTDELCKSDQLLDLADASLRHILEMKKQGIQLEDISRGCGGASSVITKKVLLMKAVREDFGVEITPEISGRLTTVTALAEYIAAQYQKEQTCPFHQS